MNSPSCGPKGTVVKNASAGYLPVWNPGVVQQASTDPLEAASKHSSVGTSAPGSWNLITKRPSVISATSFSKRCPGGPRCGRLLPNALCIFQLTRGICCAWAWVIAKPVATATAAAVHLVLVLPVMIPSSFE